MNLNWEQAKAIYVAFKDTDDQIFWDDQQLALFLNNTSNKLQFLFDKTYLIHYRPHKEQPFQIKQAISRMKIFSI